eukprot:CAMPEP_0205823664 /NCGR_PEP_ID=MMETSP0206-20130828/17707_1 /ASSEMBLY_ACC=CAM_ASM_000279 /TAXON_ID=36767 /ORGANISM="Euplotes focardii, Strain TN1" /LENGTH=56 /DNA_ID=CAMNT_0053121059 /DNA_START=47 /DNA_END=214 /DNA_ORIENTATION=-
MADEEPPEPVDVKPEIEKACHSECTKEWARYQKCVDFLKSHPDDERDCTGPYFPYW